ncbi:hypothetical protein B0A52_06181 [Exophiala mesophila]|uniref:Uncharacterized protein n=1 Tax=Exophiala mesophila TaxID=212818 RepID=A0A438N2Q2_EXOME|nr:hypothetical protein B0A52_06181 [Exophiala mesophila]
MARLMARLITIQKTFHDGNDGVGLVEHMHLAFAKLGAKVVVHDSMDPEKVVHQIQSEEGSAVANRASVEDGDAVARTAIDTWGRIDILVNTIAPSAGTQLAQTVMPEDLIQAFKPEYVVPVVLLLFSDKVHEVATGLLYKV